MSRFYEIPKHQFINEYNSEMDNCRKQTVDLSFVQRIVHHDSGESCEIMFNNGYSSTLSTSEAHKLLEAWKVYCNSQDSEKLKLENEMLKQMLRDQINGKLETAKLLKEVLEK